MQQAIIYTRVSSERQVNEGGGLLSQEHRCRSYAQSFGYQVIATFSDDGVSGALIDRQGIQDLLRFLRSQREEIIVIIDDISRIARDIIAHITLRSAIRAAGGRLVSPSFNFGESASDELLETIMAATAQYGRKGNREQVLNRQKARLELGYWTFPAPPGYQYEKHPVHKKLMVPTSPARRVLKPGLEDFANGRFVTNRELALFLQDHGFFADVRKPTMTVLEKRITRILEVLPLYAGYIEYPPWHVGRVMGKHQPIITPATLSRLEERLGKKARPIAVSRSDSDGRFILRNFVRCATCGRPFTGSLAKGKYPRYYCYYQAGCASYGHSISAKKELEPAFVKLLQSLEPGDDFLDAARTVSSKFWRENVRQWDTKKNQFEKEIAVVAEDMSAIIRRLSRASDAVAMEIEKEVETLKNQRRHLESQLAKYQQAPPDFERAFERVSTWFSNPDIAWLNGSDNEKRTVHRMVFTVAPMFDKKTGFSTCDLTLPYQLSTTFVGSNSRLVDLTGESWHQFIETILLWATELDELTAAC